MDNSTETKLVPTGEPEALPRAIETLQAGGLVAFPTDTVYGLGAILTNAKAIARLFQVKSRPDDRPIPVLMADADAVGSLGGRLSPVEARLALTYWPGPLTLVVGADRALAARLGGRDTVGVRVPDNPFALQLLAQVGPLAVTSANRSGEASAQSARSVEAQLGGRIELILDGGPSPGGQPSTVVRCRDNHAEVLRPGPVTAEQIQRVIRGI